VFIIILDRTTGTMAQGPEEHSLNNITPFLYKDPQVRNALFH
jgi:hypothetical protein